MICTILPIHNEAQTLEKAINDVISILNTLDEEYILILAEDASTDGSYEICEQYARIVDNVIHLHSEHKKGRGDALKRAIAFAHDNFKENCTIIGYLDTDLSTPPKFIPVAIDKILHEGYDIVIGSRRHKFSRTHRGVKRKIFSWGYNTIINLLFHTGIKDHQCGFKFFKLSTTREVLLRSRDSKWFWDTEVLVRAKRAGLKIYEMPIEWIESQRDSKVSVWKDTEEMLMSALKLRIELWREKDG